MMNIFKKNTRSLSFLVIIASLFVGVLSGFVIDNWSFFSFNSNISIEAIISVLITTSLGIYIASILQKRISSNNSIKAIIINELESYKKEIDDLMKLLDSSKQVTDVNLKLKNLSSKLTYIEDVLELCKLKNDEISTIKNKLFMLKRKLTDRPASNGEYQISNIEIGEIRNRTRGLKQTLIKLIISINIQ